MDEQPSSSRDFQRAAAQRLTTAKFLLDHGYTLDAMYLAGYTLECTLKALILELTAVAKRAETLKKISSGSEMHNAEVLGGILKDRGRPIGEAVPAIRLVHETAVPIRAQGYGRDACLP